jgi:glutathione peroxidase
MKLFDSLANTFKKVDQGMSKATEMPQFEIQTLQGSKIDWGKFDGKYLLFVNVASACGFTPQYKGLQKLYETYKEQLEIIGLPCNQFGAQEPGNADEIATFCELNFGVSFTLTENQHPLYQWLTDANENGIKSSSVKWNFQKYLVGPDHKLIDYYYSTTDPLSKKITRHFE